MTYQSNCQIWSCYSFISNLASRLSNRVQLTTDDHRAYLDAADDAFGKDIDYAKPVKLYGKSEGKGDDRRYSTANCTGTEIQVVSGNPDKEHISTSYVERQNLTMRTNIRRFTRLTDAFSKKVESHMHAITCISCTTIFYRIHNSIKVSTAIEAGISDHAWSLEEVVGLIPEDLPKKRGPYEKKAKRGTKALPSTPNA